MQVLSVPQPWAQLIVIGAKSIHTSSDVFKQGEAFVFAEPGDAAAIRRIQRQKYFQWFLNDYEELPTGVIIGRVTITRIDPVEKIILANKWQNAFTSRAEKQVECALGDYRPGLLAHTLENPVEFTLEELMEVNEIKKRAVAF